GLTLGALLRRRVLALRYAGEHFARLRACVREAQERIAAEGQSFHAAVMSVHRDPRPCAPRRDPQSKAGQGGVPMDDLSRGRRLCRSYGTVGEFGAWHGDPLEQLTPAA